MSTTKTMLILSNTICTTIVLTMQNLISFTSLGWGLPLLALSAIPTLSLAIQAACCLTNQERNTLSATTCLMALSSIMLYCLPLISLNHTIITLSIATLLSIQYAISTPITQNDNSKNTRQLNNKGDENFDHDAVFSCSPVRSGRNPGVDPTRRKPDLIEKVFRPKNGKAFKPKNLQYKPTRRGISSGRDLELNDYQLPGNTIGPGPGN